MLLELQELTRSTGLHPGVLASSATALLHDFKPLVVNKLSSKL